MARAESWSWESTSEFGNSEYQRWVEYRLGHRAGAAQGGAVCAEEKSGVPGSQREWSQSNQSAVSMVTPRETGSKSQQAVWAGVPQEGLPAGVTR